MGSFGSLSIGISGLYANQKGLETVSHNIANADNPEYVRQSVNYSDSFVRQAGAHKVGTGTSVQGINQIRDEFLDIKLRGQVSEYGYWGERYNIFTQVESIMNETGEIDDKVTGGLAKTMDDFWKAFDELAKDPSNLTVRAVLKERTEGFVTTVRHMEYQLDTLQKNLNTRVENIVDETNRITTQIADLNKEIVAREASGVSANDYRDKRNGLVDRLSQIVDISVSEDSKGYVNIAVSGIHVVLEGSAKQLECKLPVPPEKGQLVNVHWAGEDKPLELGKDIKSGELLAVLEARGDGEGKTASANSKEFENLIPTMKSKLNELVTTIALAINNQQMDGYTLDGVKAGPSGGMIEVVQGKKQMISFDKKDVETASKISIKYEYGGSNADATAQLNASGDEITIKLGTDAKNNTAEKIQESLQKLTFPKYKDENGNIFKDAGGNEIPLIDASKIIVEGDDLGDIPTDILESQAKDLNKVKTISIFDVEGGGPLVEYKLDSDKNPVLDANGKMIIDKVNIDASNLKLNIKSLNDIAAASKLGEIGNSANAEAIMGIRDALLYGDGNFNIDDFYRDIMSDFGIGGQESRNMMDAHGRIIIELDNKKQSVSAVSLDEEMSNMLKFQHAYSASTRFINAIDEMLDVIINRMGK